MKSGLEPMPMYKVDLKAMTSQVLYPDDSRGPLREVVRLSDTNGQLQRRVTPNPWL